MCCVKARRPPRKVRQTRLGPPVLQSPASSPSPSTLYITFAMRRNPMAGPGCSQGSPPNLPAGCTGSETTWTSSTAFSSRQSDPKHGYGAKIEWITPPWEKKKKKVGKLNTGIFCNMSSSSLLRPFHLLSLCPPSQYFCLRFTGGEQSWVSLSLGKGYDLLFPPLRAHFHVIFFHRLITESFGNCFGISKRELVPRRPSWLRNVAGWSNRSRHDLSLTK